MYVRALKPLFDRLFALFGLLLLWPFLVLIGLLVTLDSPGGPLFLQSRVGRGGREFRMWKFRTMVQGAERGPLLTEAGDRRITRIGRILRRWSLDELPQLVNVLAGHMSLIGPRPEVPPLVAQWPLEARRILTVRPGLTGWAQVHGRDWVSIPDKIQLDLAYVDRLSWWLDLQILWRTLSVVVLGTGVN